MESSVKVAVIGILGLFICVDFAMADAEKIGILPECSWAGLYNFGDSNSNTGGISAHSYRSHLEGLAMVAFSLTSLVNDLRLLEEIGARNNER
ncbi:hypothetical protein L1887_10181 [Cichorium endivia]|nr:hypothetical protein L1887_10181 [Cichorium endivia]